MNNYLCILSGVVVNVIYASSDTVTNTQWLNDDGTVLYDSFCNWDVLNDASIWVGSAVEPSWTIIEANNGQ